MIVFFQTFSIYFLYLPLLFQLFFFLLGVAVLRDLVLNRRASVRQEH